jgi:hypothetical protein
VAFCADTGYPRTRFDAGALRAAELLRRVSHGDIAEWVHCSPGPSPPVAPSVMARRRSGPDRSGGQLPLACRRAA